MLKVDDVFEFAGNLSEDLVKIFNRGHCKMKKIYMVNEYLEYPEVVLEPPVYLKSYVFLNESEARKFLRFAKKQNTKNKGDYRYEMEIDSLYDNHKAAKEWVEDRDKS